MRVTHVSPSGEIGGAERVILECLAVDAAVHNSVVTLADGPFLRAAETYGASTRCVPMPESLAAAGDAFDSTAGAARALLPTLWALPEFSRRFSRALVDDGPDLIHSHGIKTHLLSAMQSRRAPVVWHLHDYLSTRSASSKLLRLLGRRCALAIAVSDSVARDARRVLPASVPVMVVHNSVDVDRFVPSGPAVDLDALSGLAPAPRGTVRIGLPATFAKWKGHDVFLHAVARLRHSGVRAYIVGGPVYRTRNSQWTRIELEAIVERLGLRGQVGFAGLVDDMPSVYRALDIVVHASTRPEPFGLVIAEALACGRPLIASREGGAGELFADGVHALAAPGSDAAALAAAIDRLTGNQQEREAFGIAGRAHAIRAFSRERFAADLRSALAVLTASAPALEFV